MSYSYARLISFIKVNFSKEKEKSLILIIN